MISLVGTNAQLLEGIKKANRGSFDPYLSIPKAESNNLGAFQFFPAIKTTTTTTTLVASIFLGELYIPWEGKEKESQIDLFIQIKAL